MNDARWLALDCVVRAPFFVRAGLLRMCGAKDLLDCLRPARAGYRDFLLPFWWVLAATIPIAIVSWWVAYRSEWF